MGLLVAIPATLAPPLTHHAFAASYATTVLADAPDAYWRLGESSGTTAGDATGHGYNATISGGVTLGTSGALLGDSATAMSFDGQTGSIDTPYNQNAVSAYSVEMWINTTDTGSKQLEQDRAQGGNTSGMSLTMSLGTTGGQHGGPGTLSFELDSNNIEIGQTTVGTVNDGTWHHVVGTWSAAAGTAVSPSQFHIYVDGFLAPSTASVTNFCNCTPQSPLTGLGGLHLARNESGLPYQGKMEEAAVYTHVLSRQRVAAHYTASGRTLPGAVPASSTYGLRVVGDRPSAYFRLGDPAGTTVVADSSGNGNSGLVSGTIAFGASGALPNESTATAASFNGGTVTTSYVQSSVTAYAEEVWIKTTSTANKVMIFTDRGQDGSGHSLSMYLGQTGGLGSGPGRITFEMDTNNQDVGVSGTPLVNDGQWHHVVGTWSASAGTALDPSQFRLYIDGASVATTPDNNNYCGCPAITSPLSGNGGVWMSPTTVLGNPAIQPPPFVGSLEEAAIYAYALSANQVHQHFLSAGIAQAPAGPPITKAEVPTGDNFCWRCYAKRTVQGSRAEPVSTATGAFYESYTDLSIPGRGLPIAFTRTYSSARASSNGPLGYGWTDGYAMSLSTDGSGNATITGPDGSQTVFTLSGATYTGPPRAEATLVKNADGSYTFTQALRTAYTFTASGQLTREKDLNGYVTALAYNGSGQLAAITDPAGRSVTLGYTGSHLTGLTDPMGRTVTFAYDNAGNLSSVTDVNGAVTTVSYDVNHLLLTITDPRNNVVTTNHYDSSQRVDWQTDGLNRQTTFSYSGTPLSSAGGSTMVTDPKGNVTVDQYLNGERTAITRGYGTAQQATWQYRYDPGSLGPSIIMDPNGNVTSYTYDANGNRTSATDPLGRTTTYTYDSLNDLTSTTDPNGVTTTLTYDSNGNLLSRSTPLVGTSQSQTVTYTYGDSTHPGDVTAVTDPDGKVSHTTYDANGDVASTTDPVGDMTTVTYNAVGWPLTTVSPLGNVSGGTPSQHTTTTTYDKYGDLLTIADPLGDTLTNTYDADRNLASRKDADGNTSTYTYDAANQLTVTTRADTPATTLKTDYWPDGSVKDQVDGAGDTTSYSYDSLGHLSATTDPLGRVTTTTSDAVGNLLTQQDPVSGASCTATPKVGCTTMAYDAANELTAITYSDGITPNVTMGYDADGQRTAMTDGTGTSTWTWDSLHRLTGATNGAGAHIGYAYSLRGEVTTLTYPDATTVGRGYDDAGRLTGLTDWANASTTFRYDADSNLIGETAPGSVTGTFGVDNADRSTSISYAAGATSLLALSYSRDGNGQVTQTTAGSSPTPSNYTYTALNQLRADTATPYHYDSADNLMVNAGTFQSFDAAGELCWTAPVTGASCTTPPPLQATSYSYDSRGDRTGMAPPSGAATTYGYDQARRLVSYTSGSTSATYAYNGDGLRVSKTVGTTPAEAFTWDATGGLPLAVQDGTLKVAYGPSGLPVEQSNNTTTQWYLHDQLGSTRALTDSTGAVVATYGFDAFGNQTAATGSASTPLRYASQYRDAESGLYYLRARYYDPATAQFLTRDPAVAETRSPYGYANDNPLNKVDPTGLEETPGSVQRTINRIEGLLKNILEDNRGLYQKALEGDESCKQDLIRHAA